eukprot:7976-Prorocentrum_lima.AAC.1
MEKLEEGSPPARDRRRHSENGDWCGTRLTHGRGSLRAKLTHFFRVVAGSGGHMFVGCGGCG